MYLWYGVYAYMGGVDGVCISVCVCPQRAVFDIYRLNAVAEVHCKTHISREAKFF